MITPACCCFGLPSGLTVFFRIGISRHGEVALAGAHSGQTATNFLEDCGASWGARRDVVARAGFAIGEALEALYGAEVVNGPVTLHVSFDEYKLLLDLNYPGRAINFAANQKIDLEALLEDDDEDAALDAAMSGMSGQLIKHLADRVTSNETAGRALLRLRFNH